MNNESIHTLERICGEQGVWQEENFGSNQDFGWTVIGVVEEIGDLANAYLKRHQGIRDGEEKFQARFVDAVGDIVIFLMGAHNSAGLNFSEMFIHPAPTIPSSITTHKRLLLGKAAKYASRLTTADMVFTVKGSDADWANILVFNSRGLLFCLNELCKMEGTDLVSCVEDTWNTIVQKRDWTKHPSDGGVEQDL